MNCLVQRKKFKNKHPVWTDPDDKTLDVAKQIGETNDEAPECDSGSGSEEEGGEFGMYANDVRSKKYKLETKELRFKHLVDINSERSFKGGVQQVQFNPNSKIALVTLRSGQADLFEVDGERNRYIQNIKLPRTKQPFCAFKSDGDSIVISSEKYKGNFFTYDMLSGSIKTYSHRAGLDPKPFTDFALNEDYMACRLEGSQEISILSTKTYENTFSFHINEPVRGLQFCSNNQLFVAGENAQVYIWDLRKTSICKHRFQDEGSVHSTSLTISEPSKLLSVGSDSGVVNSYELEQCLTSRYPTPIKTFCNLKTSVDILKYNSTGELLLIGSRSEPIAFRMVHSHSGTVYKNFPKQGKRYGHLISGDFSPLSGHLALGCSTGRAHLCRIPYYKSY